MCGKFTQLLAWREARDYPDFVKAREGPTETATPMRFVNVLRLNVDRAREMRPMRWGFMGLKAATPAGPPEHIHARAETLDTKPTFRDAFATARGILVGKTFNEGKEITPTKTEQHIITPRDGMRLASRCCGNAGVHNSNDELRTFVMVRTHANKLIGTITDRMPAVIAPEHWGKWLGEEPASAEELMALLQPFEGDWEMEAEFKPPKWKPKRPSAQTELY